jgi:hypothetical protein
MQFMLYPPDRERTAGMAHHDGRARGVGVRRGALQAYDAWHGG